jgi:hypothetical protein
MNLAPHVSFRANVPPEAEYEHLPGHNLAREIEARYRAEGFEIEDLDCWRDAGWFINCSVNGKRFETYFLACRDEGTPRDWVLAIAPLGQPGFIGRLFGRKPTLYVRELRRLAKMVHELVLAQPDVTDVAWCFNDFPRDCPSVGSPDLLQWPPE